MDKWKLKMMMMMMIKTERFNFCCTFPIWRLWCRNCKSHEFLLVLCTSYNLCQSCQNWGSANLCQSCQNWGSAVTVNTGSASHQKKFMFCLDSKYRWRCWFLSIYVILNIHNYSVSYLLHLILPKQCHCIETRQ